MSELLQAVTFLLCEIDGAIDKVIEIVKIFSLSTRARLLEHGELAARSLHQPTLAFQLGIDVAHRIAVDLQTALQLPNAGYETSGGPLAGTDQEDDLLAQLKMDGGFRVFVDAKL